MDDLPDSPNSFGGHGTKVAGVVGAITNNDLGVAGIMWNCKIMPVKMVRGGGIRIPHILNWEWNESAFPSDVADAIDYAVNNGAHIINLSYSFPSMGWPINEVALRVPLLFQSLNNAYNTNMVITASMGNQGSSDVRYPAGFRHQVVAVGTTTRLRQKASFSNTGSHISVSAPGVDILTTERNGGTRSVSGTSFSAPIVAGVAGLIISQGKDRGFNLTNDDVRNILELTSEDVDPVGFDEETGHGIVNAYNALHLLDEPNEVVHGVSYGGSTTKTNLSTWVYTGGNWNLAAGTYYNVDRYKVTKRVDFDVPFCSPPAVWMRDRQSACLSAASPNDGYPFAEITGVTETGFDVTYYTYYVRYNVLGQTLNKWVPATISNSKVAYTAVGELNMAGTAGPISGPDIVCSTPVAFTLNNLPAGCSVSWSRSSNLAYVSGQGTVNYTVKAANSTVNGQGWVKATINNGNCGPATIKKEFYVGTPSPSILEGPFDASGYTGPACKGEPYQFSVPLVRGVTSYQWRIISPVSSWWWILSNSNTETYCTDNLGLHTMGVRQKMDGCSLSQETTLTFPVVDCFTGSTCGGTGGGPKLLIASNPSSIEITVCEIEPANENTPWELRLLNQQGVLVVNVNTTLPKTINVQGLQPGVYLLHARQGEYVEQLRVVVE